MAMRTRKAGPAAASSDGETANCVGNLIHAFTNGLNIFKRLREKRRRRKKSKHKSSGGEKEGASNAELQLSNSLRRGPKELQMSYDNCYGSAGERFAKGDSIAHASLAETLIKLNTGLVSIIAAFLNHDSKAASTHLNLDFKSLTHLSDVSRREAVDSMHQLCQRLNQSQLQIQRIGGCAQCGSMKHHSCPSPRRTASPEKSSSRRSSSKQRVGGTIVARVPIRKSSQTQLVVVRPKPGRKGSGSSSSSSKSHSQANSTALSSEYGSPYTSPLASPLPQYSPIDPFPPQPRKTSPAPAKHAAPVGRRRADSFDGPRPTTWPHTRPDTSAPFQFPAAPPKPPKIPLNPHPRASPSPASPREKSPRSPKSPPAVKRRMDKATPSTYTFASDSTKLGEIPQRNWTTPWDWEEAERLNQLAATMPVAPVVEGSGRQRKKGLFGFLRRGSAQGV